MDVVFQHRTKIETIQILILYLNTF